MGNYKSNAIFKGQTNKVCASIPDVLNEQALFEEQYVKPLEIQVAHYTPASFPLVPHVTGKTMEICRRSWEKIIMPVQKEDQEVSGLIIFYTEFYDTLEVFDRTGKFESVLRQHSVGMDAAAAKGAILIRIIHYALALDPEAEKSAYMLFTLGKSHNHKRIRPWQYSVFIQVLLNTMSSRLGQDATEEVMSAWVHLFAFILRSILPIAIKGLVNETEVDINVSTDLGDAKITDEIQQQDEVREMKKVLTGSKGRVGSSNSRSASANNSHSGSRLNSPRSHSHNS
jgi:hemoglobin-like flavoprotein